MAIEESIRCRFCKDVEIREYDFGSGPEWLHIGTDPVTGRLGPYKHCKTSTVATPPETVKEWIDKLFKPSDVTIPSSDATMPANSENDRSTGDGGLD